MANRSYLYSISFDKTTEDRQENDKIVDLSEYSYNIPISYKILVSQDTKLSHSIIWDYENPIAIQGNFQKGKQKLFLFLEKLKNENIFDSEELEKYITDTKTFIENNELENVILECGEIYEMNDEDLEIQNQQLFDEIYNINNTIDNLLNELKSAKLSLEKMYVERENLSNPSFFSKIFSSNKSRTEELDKNIEITKNNMWWSLGIDYWSNILYYDFSDENSLS